MWGWGRLLPTPPKTQEPSMDTTHLRDAGRPASGALVITPECRIPRSELSFRTSRGGGPGGQHVNKVETRVELLFNIAKSQSLSRDQRARLLEKLGTRLDADGVLRVVCSASRSQWQNKERAVDRFVRLIREALKRRAVRKKTRPSSSSRERRIHAKKRRAETKQLRKPPEG